MRASIPTLFPLLGFATTVFFSANGRAGPCESAATAFAKKKADSAASFIDPKGKSKELLPCPACTKAYYFMDADKGTPNPAPAPPSDFTLSKEFTGPSNWQPLPLEGCPSLKMLAFIRNTGVSVAPTKPESAAVDPAAAERAKAIDDFQKASDLKDAIGKWKIARKANASLGSGGPAHGAVDIASEAAQILGQIVVDRASSAAYELIKQKLEKFLECTQPPVFKATCAVLTPLRIQDVATSRDALFGGLVKDGLGWINQHAPKLVEWAETTGPLIGGLAAVVLPVVFRPQGPIDSGRARAVLNELFDWAAQKETALGTGTSTAVQAVVMAVIAYGKCEVAAQTQSTGSTGQQGSLATCDIAAQVDQLSGVADAKQPARLLASALLSAATLVGDNKVPDGRQRLIAATDAVLGATCMVLKAEPQPRLMCDDANDVTALVKPEDALALIQPILDAALARDTNAVVASVVHGLVIAGKEPLSKTRKRGLLLLGAILQYGETYGAHADAGTAHETRTKILESLTRDMTDRTKRDGDTIVSIGGSLRAVGGARFDSNTKALYGPLSLPLGFAVDHLAQRDNCWPSFHLELDALELGEYITFDNNGSVRKPDLQDALAPSLTVAMAWGYSLPFILGATFGYSPNAVLDPTHPEKNGSFRAGVVAGIYVPLFDAN